MEEIILLIQKTYGLMGILMLAPLGAYYLQWRENLRLNKELKHAGEAVTAAQAQRVVDAQSISGKLLEMAQQQSALNTETNLVLQRVSSVLERIHEDRWEKGRR